MNRKATNVVAPATAAIANEVEDPRDEVEASQDNFGSASITHGDPADSSSPDREDPSALQDQVIVEISSYGETSTSTVGGLQTLQIEE